MVTLYIQHLSLWTPLEQRETDLTDFLLNPFDIDEYELPALSQIPKRKQRRFNPLTKIVLETAFAVTPEEPHGDLLTVLSSRHGDLGNSIAILEDIAHEELVRPQQFSHSVLNVPFAYYSMEMQNRAAATAVSSDWASFAVGFMESVLQLAKNPGMELIYTCADLPIPEPISHFDATCRLPYSLSLKLSSEKSDGATAVTFSMGDEVAKDVASGENRVPQALRFYNWLMTSDAKSLVLGRENTTYVWKKD